VQNHYLTIVESVMGKSTTMKLIKNWLEMLKKD